MFAPRWLIERLLDIHRNLADKTVAAYAEAFNVSLSAKQDEVAILKRQIADIEEQVRYQTARADALVDRLLLRDAKVYPVQPIAAEQAKKQQEAAIKALSEIGDQLAQVGEDEPGTLEPREHVFAGGASGIREQVTNAPRA